MFWESLFSSSKVIMLKSKFSTVWRNLISVIIIAFLILQGGVTFRLFPTAKSDPAFLWPFVTYPMYREAHYEGDTIDRFLVFVLLEDSTKVQISPKEMGLGYWLFQENVIVPIMRRDKDKIDNFMEIYKTKHPNFKPINLILENHGWKLTKKGYESDDIKIIKNIKLNY